MRVEQITAPLRRRTDPTGDERELLLDFLNFYRDTLLIKCAGLSVTELATRCIPPSNLSLLGLLRHMAAGEQYWTEEIFLASLPARYYYDEHDPDADFNDVASADLETVVNNFAAARAISDEIARRHDLSSVAAANPDWPEPPVTLRWICIHLIEEYARHCGHADLLREGIDGVTGR